MILVFGGGGRRRPYRGQPVGTEFEATHIETKPMSGCVALTMRRVAASGRLLNTLHVILTPAEMRDLMTDGFAAASEAETWAEKQDDGRWDNRRKA